MCLRDAVRIFEGACYVYLLALHRTVPKSRTMSVRAMSEHFLSSAKLDAVITSLDGAYEHQYSSSARHIYATRCTYNFGHSAFMTCSVFFPDVSSTSG